MTGERLGGTGDALPENHLDAVDRVIEELAPEGPNENRVRYDTEDRRRAIAAHLVRIGNTAEIDAVRLLIQPPTPIEAQPNQAQEASVPVADTTVLHIDRSAQA